MGRGRCGCVTEQQNVLKDMGRLIRLHITWFFIFIRAIYSVLRLCWFYKSNTMMRSVLILVQYMDYMYMDTLVELSDLSENKKMYVYGG